MKRRRSPYRLFKRKVKKGRPIFYCRFIDVDTGRIIKTESTGETNQFRAVHWVDEHLQREEAKSETTLADIAVCFWELDGEYAQARLARGHSVSNVHLSISEGHTRNHILPKFGDLRVSDITPGMVETWILDLHRAGDFAPATINKLLATLRSLLDRAVTHGMIPDNPAKAVKRVGKATKERGVLTDSEVQALLTTPEHWPDYRHYVINLLAFTTGMRLGEIRGLPIENVHSDRVESRRYDSTSGIGVRVWVIRQRVILPNLQTETGQKAVRCSVA